MTDDEVRKLLQILSDEGLQIPCYGCGALCPAGLICIRCRRIVCTTCYVTGDHNWTEAEGPGRCWYRTAVLRKGEETLAIQEEGNKGTRFKWEEGISY